MSCNHNSDQFFKQRISEIDLKEFKYGGVNFTGFRLVNPNDASTKNFQKNWSKLGHVNWPGSNYPIKVCIK